jgi:putative ABC transport system permease protein
MRDSLVEIRQAARGLARARGYTLSVVLILGLAVGANVTVYGVVHAVLERPLPFRDPERVVAMFLRVRDGDRYPLSVSELLRYRSESRTLADLAGMAGMSVNMTGDGEAERVSGLRAGGNLFALLGVGAEIGRTLLPSDDASGARVAVITDGLWRRRYGADPGVVGRTLRLNGESYELVGVLPPAFRFPSALAEVAVPLAAERDPMRQNLRAEGTLRCVGRLRPGVTIAEAEAELGRLVPRLNEESGDRTGSKLGVHLAPYLDDMIGGVRRWLWALEAALAGLSWLRAAGRSRELAVRSALGATASRLTRGSLVESPWLGAAAGVVGGFAAWWGLLGLAGLAPRTLPRAHEIVFDLPVALFGVVLALGGGLLAAAWPALLASRVRLIPALKEGGAPTSGSGGRARTRTRRALVAAEIALAMLLLAGAALFLRSFVRLVGVDPGYDTHGVLIARLALPRGRYGDPAVLVRFHDRLHDALRTLPGVESAALVSIAPMSGPLGSADVWRGDRSETDPGVVQTAQYRVISPDYLETVRTPLVRGRAFGGSDRADAPPVAIVSRLLADQIYAKSEDPIGRTLMVDDRPAGARPVTVVGVAADVRHEALDAPPVPDIYLPIAQLIPEGTAWLANNQFWAVRAHGRPETLARAIQESVRTLDADVAAGNIRPFDAYLEDSVSLPLLVLRLVGLFAAAALVLSATGLYGLVSYSVGQRTREIGVRMALGAGRSDVRRLVLSEAVSLALCGVAAGTVLTLALTRLVEGLLFGVAPGDPLALALAAASLLSAALAASWLPARSAMRISPLLALRSE